MLGGTPKAIVLVALTVGLSTILLTSASAVAADTRFKACRHSNDAAKHTAASAVSQSRLATDDPHCSSVQNSSLSSLGELTERAPSILNHLEITKIEMKNSQDFDRAIQQKVFQHLDEAIAKYDRWSSCETPCRLNSETVETSRQQYERMRLELSLMQPDDPTIQARQSPKSWIASRPRHPFAAAASLPLSTAEERDQARGEFLRRLSEKKISTTLGDTREEVTRIDKAMIDIRSEARRNYLALISDNPLLLFLNSDSQTSSKASKTEITSPQIREASKKLADEIRSEKARLLELPMADRLEALIDYAPLAERILKQNPQLCNTAEKLA